jgi:Escherichia/Staphylococcus phage prohead protease
MTNRYAHSSGSPSRAGRPNPTGTLSLPKSGVPGFRTLSKPPENIRAAGRGWGGALHRETKFAPAELSEVEADGSFSGYASLFGETDLNRDRVLPGAFLKSIGARGAAGIRMLFQHDPAAPIGVWREVREDSRGLFVRGQLMREVEKAREVLALMRAGAIDGLSIGFRTVKGRTDAKSGIRSLVEIDLWEISVVTFPMLPAARVSQVKGARREALVETMRRAARRMAGGE